MLSRVAIGPRWGSAKPSSMLLSSPRRPTGCGGAARPRRPERRGAGARRGGAGNRGGGGVPPARAPRTGRPPGGGLPGDRRGPGGRARRAREREGRGGDEHLVAPIVGACLRQLLEVEHLAERQSHVDDGRDVEGLEAVRQ